MLRYMLNNILARNKISIQPILNTDKFIIENYLIYYMLKL